MSEIDYTSIDSLFPRQGVDNSSQGFRDNFEYIKNGLAIASSEITDLQQKALLKAPLVNDPQASPTQTEWNTDGWAGLSNVRDREFTTFYKASGFLNPTTILNTEFVMRDMINDKFYKFDFSVWGDSTAQSPVTYTRVQINSDGVETPYDNGSEVSYLVFDSSATYIQDNIFRNGNKYYTVLYDDVSPGDAINSISALNYVDSHDAGELLQANDTIFSVVNDNTIVPVAFASRVVYDETSGYSAGLCVSIDDIIYEVSTDIAALASIPLYDPNASYASPDVVVKNGVICQVTENILPLIQTSEYNSNTTYQVGDTFRYNNEIYYTLATATGVLPSNTNYFKLVIVEVLQPVLRTVLEEMTYTTNSVTFTKAGGQDIADAIDFGITIRRDNEGSIYNAEYESNNENDFQFNTISNVVLQNSYGKPYIPLGTQGASIILDVLSEGREYFKYTVADGFYSIDFTNWPTDSTGGYLFVKLRIEFVSDGTSREVQFGVAGTKHVSSNLPAPRITTSATAGESVIIDVWSYNSGNDVYFAKIDDFRIEP